MPGFIKTKEDEKQWSKAKSLSRKKFPKKGKKFYSYANAIFHKIKDQNESSINHEDDYLTSFKTWFNSVNSNSSSDNMLSKIKKNKYDSTLEKPDHKNKKSKKHRVTVWGAPNSFDYIRG